MHDISKEGAYENLITIG